MHKSHDPYFLFPSPDWPGPYLTTPPSVPPTPPNTHQSPVTRSAEMYHRLADAGAEIVVNSFLPPRHEGLYPAARAGWGYSLPFRADHRKLFVIDGAVAWTGGAGIEDHFHDGRFFDVMVRVTGDVVRLSQAVFLTSFASHRAIYTALI